MFRAQDSSATSNSLDDAPGSASKRVRLARHPTARYLRVGAVLLFILPTFAFLTCDIYLQLSSGRSDGGKSGHRVSLRMARTAAPANRRRLEATSQPGGVPALQPPTDTAPAVMLADVPSEQADALIAAPNLVSADRLAQQAAADTGPPDEVPADIPAEQAPFTKAAPDNLRADIPGEQALAVSAASEVERADVPTEQAPPVMASPDEVAGGKPAPVVIMVMTPTMFVSGFDENVEGCEWNGHPLGCHFLPINVNDSALYQRADAVFYHGPELCANKMIKARSGHVRRARAAQLAVVMSMESAANYNCLDDPAFMAEFDFEMTYRQDSQLPITYLRDDHMDAWMHDPAVPFDQRLDSPAFVQSNCWAASGRDATVGHLMKFRDLNIRSYGRCHNTEGSRNGTSEGKVAIYKRHKFCLVMENSIAADYVTEKLFDAFAGGCVPIYMGAPNIEAFLPDPDAIVDMRKFSSLAALRAEIMRLTRDRAAWEAKVAWRRKPVSQLSHMYQQQVENTQGPSAQCQLCAAMADHRAGNHTEVDAFREHWRYQTEEQRAQELVDLLMADFKGMQ